MRALTLLVALLAAALAVAGCGGEAAVDPRRTVQAAVVAMNAVTSLHFRLEMESAGIHVLPGMVASLAEGDIARPDKMQAVLRAVVSGVPVKFEFRAVGGAQFVSNPLAPGTWVTLPASAVASSILDPNAGVTTILSGLEELRFVATESLAGVRVHRIAGSSENDIIATYLRGTAVEGKTRAEVWIGAEDALVRRVTLNGRSLVDDAETAVRTFEFSRFNDPVEIVAPA